MIKYQLQENSGCFGLELTPQGRLWAAAQRFARASLATAFIFTALLLIDLIAYYGQQETGLGSVMTFIAGLSALIGGIFAVLELLSRARWELDTHQRVARRWVRSAFGQESEGDVPVDRIKKIEVQPPPVFWGGHQLVVCFEDGSCEALAETFSEREALVEIAESLTKQLRKMRR